MSDDARGTPDNPGVIAPPPMIYVGALLLGLLANRLSPIPFLPRTLGRALGWPLVLSGLAIGALGLRELRPLYVGMTLIYGGVTARANALPAALLLPLILHLMRRGVIEREERYLERKFGDQYLSYKARVRRWV
jgi:protein-S-isoprenylcysteine O-methyltransferase Ste14